MHWVPTGQTVNKEYSVKVLREFRKRPALFKSAQWHFHLDKCTSPQLHPCHRLFDRRYETIEEMKEAVSKVIDTLTQEDFQGAFQKREIQRERERERERERDVLRKIQRQKRWTGLTRDRQPSR